MYVSNQLKEKRKGIGKIMAGKNNYEGIKMWQIKERFKKKIIQVEIQTGEKEGRQVGRQIDR